MSFEAIVEGIDLGPQRGVRIKCKPCPHCGQSAMVDVEEDEYSWLSSGVPASQALSAHPAAVRELFITGLHEHCWNSYLGLEDE